MKHWMGEFWNDNDELMTNGEVSDEFDSISNQLSEANKKLEELRNGTVLKSYNDKYEEANKKLELSESWVKHHQKSVELKCEKLAIAVDVLEGIRDSRFALTRTAAHEALKKITQ